MKWETKSSAQSENGEKMLGVWKRRCEFASEWESKWAMEIKYDYRAALKGLLEAQSHTFEMKPASMDV